MEEIPESFECPCCSDQYKKVDSNENYNVYECSGCGDVLMKKIVVQSAKKVKKIVPPVTSKPTTPITKPKRPITAYFHFQTKNRPIAKLNHPEANGKEISKILGEAWKTLPQDKKKVYEDLMTKDKARYQMEKQKFISNHTTLPEWE